MSLLRRMWSGWKRFGQMMGDLLARVVLTIFYFTIFAPFGLGVALLGDPLGIRPGQGPRWLPRSTTDLTVQDARRLG